MKNNPAQEQLAHLRHSYAHLLARSVIELYPDSHNAIGPSTEDGFYQDFDTGEHVISIEDLPQIEKKMRQLLKSWTDFQITQVNVDQARQDFAHNPYKIELIEEFHQDGEALTETKQGDFLDLCKGGHSVEIHNHPHFKLLSVAGAYWRGSEKNKMLTRIYGTAFFTQKELDEYLRRQEEAKRRDHKKLGVELDLFTFSETIGKGLPLLTPKGSVIRRELERFIIDEEIKRGYLHVYTPDIANLKLYEKSGHYPYYKDSMYAPITIDEEQFMLRPMTCPHHFELYLSKPRSYKDLPMRIAEVSQLYRYEKSGELMGLLRVRSFSLADAHIVCRRSQAKTVINEVFDLIEYLTSIFGLKMGENFHYRLSLGNRRDSSKYFKDDAAWDFAEEVLRSVLQERCSIFVEAEDEAAFYGPKVDVQMKNVNGKEDTACTNQYDFVMPKRFGMIFTNQHGEDEEPVVIHRASLGALERTIAFLIEHFAGAFPVWLSPVQAVVIPINSDQVVYAKLIEEKLKEKSVRVELWDQTDSMQKRIRNAEAQKIPYIIVVGEKEAHSDNISLRVRGKIDRGTIKADKFITEVLSKIQSKSLEL